MSASDLLARLGPGAALVAAFEGCEQAVPGRPGHFRAYRCPAGVLTIGWGHTNAAPPYFGPNDIWTADQCDEVLISDLDRVAVEVDHILTSIHLNPHERAALVSFHFNTGGLGRSSIPAKLRSGRRDEVGPTLQRWVKAKGKVLRGLVRRRQAEALMFEGRVAEALRVARVSSAPPARQVDRPEPSRSILVGEAVAGLGGAGLIGAGAIRGTGVIELAAIILGLVIAAAALFLATRRWRQISADWA